MASGPAASTPASPSASPRSICDRMTPLLPRAPQKAPPATDSAAAPTPAASVSVSVSLVRPARPPADAGGGDAGAQRQQHIGAGVAVRHREHIEGVGGVPVQFQISRRAGHCLPPVRTVQRCASASCRCHSRARPSGWNGGSIAQGARAGSRWAARAMTSFRSVPVRGAPPSGRATAAGNRRRPKAQPPRPLCGRGGCTGFCRCGGL